jgi:hypothetical protein
MIIVVGGTVAIGDAGFEDLDVASQAEKKEEGRDGGLV